MIAKLQTKAAKNRRAQLREIEAYERMERRLEKAALPKIRKQLNTMARLAIRDFEIGGVDRANDRLLNGRKVMEETLRPIYTRAIKESEKLMFKQNPKDKEAVAQVKKDLEEAFENQVKRASKQVQNATDRQLKEIARKGAEQNLEKKDIVKAMKKKLIRSNTQRSQIIAATEIGSVTADARESIVLRTQTEPMFKIWTTRRDSKVRDDHQFAEGQAVFLDEAFTVGGEKLPYPRWRGARPENRINCRCKIIYEKVN